MFDQGDSQTDTDQLLESVKVNWCHDMCDAFGNRVSNVQRSLVNVCALANEVVSARLCKLCMAMIRGD